VGASKLADTVKAGSKKQAALAVAEHVWGALHKMPDDAGHLKSWGQDHKAFHEAVSKTAAFKNAIR